MDNILLFYTFLIGKYCFHSNKIIVFTKEIVGEHRILIGIFYYRFQSNKLYIWVPNIFVHNIHFAD